MVKFDPYDTVIHKLSGLTASIIGRHEESRVYRIRFGDGHEENVHEIELSLLHQRSEPEI